MKLKLSELRPNPFKKQISKGELNKEQVDKIKANIKELGFFGSLPVFKKDNQYYLIAGHHRTQALKEVYGKDWEVKVEVSDYNDEQIAKAMIIENLTQRTDDYRELSDNVIFARDFLSKNKDILQRTRTESGRVKGSYQKEEYKDNVTSMDIAWWVDKETGDVMSKTEINDLIKIKENLHPELERQVEKKHDKSRFERAEDNPNYTQALILSSVKKDEQTELLKVLKDTREQRVREQGKLVTKYKDAPEDVKEQVKKGSVDLADIDLAITQSNLRDKKKNKIEIIDISKKIDGFIERLSFSISDSESNLKGVLKDIAVISRYVKDMNEKQKARLSGKLNNLGNLLSKLGELIKNINNRLENG